MAAQVPNHRGISNFAMIGMKRRFRQPFEDYNARKAG